MATQLKDIFVPVPFTDTVSEQSVFKNAFVNSGVALRSPMMDALASGPGLRFDVPFLTSPAYGNVDGTPSGDGAPAIVPEIINGGSQMGAKLSRNWAWDAAKLVQSASGNDVLAYAASQVSEVMPRADQNIILACLTGIFEDNVTNDGGDMIHDLGDSQGAGAEEMSREALINAAYSIGDNVSDLGIIIMHPGAIAQLKTQDLDNWTAAGAAGGDMVFDTYLGMRILADSSAGLIQGANYESYLLGAGAFAYGEANLGSLAARVDMDHKAAGGRGVETLHYSRDLILHPQGFSFSGVPATSNDPYVSVDNATLMAGANWDRVVADRRAAKIVKLITQIDIP